MKKKFLEKWVNWLSQSIQYFETFHLKMKDMTFETHRTILGFAFPRLKYIFAIPVIESQYGLAENALIYIKLIATMFLLMINTLNFYVWYVHMCT